MKIKIVNKKTKKKVGYMQISSITTGCYIHYQMHPELFKLIQEALLKEYDLVIVDYQHKNYLSQRRHMGEFNRPSKLLNRNIKIATWHHSKYDKLKTLREIENNG